MAYGFDPLGYGGFNGVPYQYWLSAPPPHYQAPPPSFPARNPVESYDPTTQGGFDPMISHDSHHQSQSYWSNNPSSLLNSSSQPPSYTDNTRLGNLNVVQPTYDSANSSPVISLAETLRLIRSLQEPYNNPITPSGVYASSNENLPGHYHPGYGTPESINVPPLEPTICHTNSVPSLPMSSLNTQSVFSQTGVPFGVGRSFSNNTYAFGHAPGSFIGAQSYLHGSSAEPVNSNVSLGYDEASGYIKPLSENPDLHNQVDGLPCGATKAGNGNSQSAVNYKAPFEGSSSKPSKDVHANQKPCKHQEQILATNRDKRTTDDVPTGLSPEWNLCDHGDFPSLTSSPRLSSVVSAMHNLSEVLVYECFNNGSWLKLEQLENLDKVVENLTKCLKKITGNKKIEGEASLLTQAMHLSCSNAVNLNEAPTGVAKDLQGFNVKPLDSFGLKEQADKNEMTQSIKNILASNFPEGEENNSQTVFFKNLWLETEAALCSTTCMTRYHRIKNEIGSLKLHKKEISAGESTFMQEPYVNSHKSVPIMNNAEQETTESLIKHGNNCVTQSQDARKSSRFNSEFVDEVLSPMSQSFSHGNFNLDVSASEMIPDTINQESPASTTENELNDVIDRFQILKEQETERKLKSQNCDHENNPEVSEMATFDRSSHMDDGMNRFQILKHQVAEQVEKSLESLDIDSDSDESKTQTLPASLTTTLHEFKTESSVAGESESDESITSDWEHVLNDD